MAGLPTPSWGLLGLVWPLLLGWCDPRHLELHRDPHPGQGVLRVSHMGPSVARSPSPRGPPDTQAQGPPSLRCGAKTRVPRPTDSCQAGGSGRAGERGHPGAGETGLSLGTRGLGKAGHRRACLQTEEGPGVESRPCGCHTPAPALRPRDAVCPSLACHGLRTLQAPASSSPSSSSTRAGTPAGAWACLGIQQHFTRPFV